MVRHLLDTFRQELMRAPLEAVAAYLEFTSLKPLDDRVDFAVILGGDLVPLQAVLKGYSVEEPAQVGSEMVAHFAFVDDQMYRGGDTEPKLLLNLVDFHSRTLDRLTVGVLDVSGQIALPKLFDSGEGRCSPCIDVRSSVVTDGDR